MYDLGIGEEGFEESGDPRGYVILERPAAQA